MCCPPRGARLPAALLLGACSPGPASFRVAPAPGGLLRGARLPGDCFMFPPRFHVPCWPRSYYTGPCSPLPCSRSLASSALSVVAVSVTTLPPVPLVSDIPFPRLLAWEDGVREIC